MYVKIEPSGCCERKGLVQVRFCFYLDPEDHGYEKHYVSVPAVPAEGVPDNLTSEQLNEWLDSLPKKQQSNPFHNHFVYFKDTVTDKEIDDMGKDFLKDAYKSWKKGKADIKNKPVKFDISKKEQAEARAASLMSSLEKD